MKNRAEYKGFLIHAAPYEIRDSGEWAVNVHIMREAGHYFKKRQFTARNTFRSEAEALEHCLDFAMQIIDGGVEGCSVED